MKIRIIKLVLGLAVLALSACASNPVVEVPESNVAQYAVGSDKVDTSIGEFTIRRLTCWDVMTAPEADMNMALMLVYGYSEGEHTRTVQSPKTIEDAFRKAFDFCESSPDAPVYRAFQIVN